MSPSKAAIEITAVDRFSAVFKSLEGKLSGASAGLEKVKAIAGVAFAAFTTGAIANSIGQVVNRLAELDDAAQITGSSVEKLSKIRNVADEFGVAFDGITGAIAKMTKGLSGADEETRGAQAAIRELGIDTRDANGHLRDSGDLFEDVARELAKYKDDTEKAAFAQAIFGKGGEKLIPFLNDYAANIGKASTVTAEQAARAADLQDAYTRMTASGTRFKEQLAIETLPVMTAVVNALQDVQSEAQKTGRETGIAVFAENAATVLAVLADSAVTFTQRLRGLGADLEGLAQYGKGVLDRLAASVALRAGAYGEASKIFAESNERFAAGSAAFRRADELNASSSTKFADALSRAVTMQKAQIGVYDDARDRVNRLAVANTAAANSDKESLGERAKALRLAAERAKTATDAARAAAAVAKELEQATEVFNRINAVDSDFSASYTKDLSALLLLFRAGKISVEEYSAAFDKLAASQPYAKREQDALNDAVKRAAEIYKDAVSELEKFNDARNRETSSLEDRAKQALEEAGNLGKTRLAIAQEIAARAERMVVLAREQGESEESIASLQRQAQAYRDLATAVAQTDAFQVGQQFAEDQRRAMEDATRSTEEFFTNLILNGKKTFGDLKQQAKQFFAQLAAQFLTRYVLNIGVNGSVSGGGGLGGVLGSLLGGGGGGGGNILGSLFSGGAGGLGSLLGQLPFVGGAGPLAAGTGLLGSLAGAGFTGTATFLGAATGGFGAGLATLGTAISSGVAAAGGLASVLGAAVPVIGPILALLSASGVFKNEKGFKFDNGADFENRRGRSNLIESLFGAYDFAGDFGNNIVQPFIDAVAKMDQGIADAFLTSPAAIEAAKLRVQAIDDGSWFGANSKEETEASLRAATLRFLKERYSAVFSTIDADIAGQIAGFSGTTDELTSFINQAVALAPILDDVNAKFPELNLTLSQLLKTAEEDRAGLLALVNALPNTVKDGWAEVEAIMARANEGIAGALQRSVRASIDLVRQSDKGALSLQSLAGALQQSQAGFAQLAQAIAGISQSIADSIAQTNDEFLLATLDEEQRYKFFQERANSAFAGIGSLTNEEAIRRAVEQINADRQAAFNLLDPEEQRARLQEFLDGGNALNEAAQAQLRIVAETAAAAQKEFADLVAKAMLDAIAVQAEAAKAQGDATDRFGNAVERFANATLRVELVNVGSAYEARAGQ